MSSHICIFCFLFTRKDCRNRQLGWVAVGVYLAIKRICRVLSVLDWGATTIHILVIINPYQWHSFVDKWPEASCLLQKKIDDSYSHGDRYRLWIWLCLPSSPRKKIWRRSSKNDKGMYCNLYTYTYLNIFSSIHQATIYSSSPTSRLFHAYYPLALSHKNT